MTETEQWLLGGLIALVLLAVIYGVSVWRDR